MAKKAKTAKHKTTPAELANDPSLRWCQYRSWELVWADGIGECRFVRYEGGQIVLGTTAMAELPGTIDPLSVRRPTAGGTGRRDDLYGGKVGAGFAKIF